MVVTGTSRQWGLLGEEEWERRAEMFGAVVGEAGGSWLTLQAYERGDGGIPEDVVDRPRRRFVVADGRCAVIVDPMGDGRERFAEAMGRLPAG